MISFANVTSHRAIFGDQPDVGDILRFVEVDLTIAVPPVTLCGRDLGLVDTLTGFSSARLLRREGETDLGEITDGLRFRWTAADDMFVIRSPLASSPITVPAIEFLEELYDQARSLCRDMKEAGLHAEATMLIQLLALG